MSQHDDRVRLQHMLDAARQAVAFVAGRRREDLDRDLQLTLALTRLVEIIGEAAKHVTNGTRQRHPQIAWRAIAGTRDRLVHAYFDVDLDQVWQIVSGGPGAARCLHRNGTCAGWLKQLCSRLSQTLEIPHRHRRPEP